MKKLLISCLEPYKEVRDILARYWKAYGEWRAFFLSPYLHIASLLGVISYCSYETGAPWWNLPISVLPSLIGFSLGGYAIFLALGDESFKKLIAGKDEADEDLFNADPKTNFEQKLVDEVNSPYIEMNTAFLHFILMQLLALVLALSGKTLFSYWANLEGEYLFFDIFVLSFGLLAFVMFTYSIFLALAATLEVYRMSWWYDAHADHEKDTKQ